VYLLNTGDEKTECVYVTLALALRPSYGRSKEGVSKNDVNQKLYFHMWNKNALGAILPVTCCSYAVQIVILLLLLLLCF
jgi:hypothetical protein